MGVLGTHTKFNLAKTRFDAALLSLLFLATYQTYHLVIQEYIWSSLLFILAGICSFYVLMTSKRKAPNKYSRLLCLVLSWAALASATLSEHTVYMNWFVILFILAYLLLTLKLANILNGIGFIMLFSLVYVSGGFTASMLQLLPCVVLLILANLLTSQFVFLASTLEQAELRDALTGCWNREYLLQEVVKLSDIYRRYHTNASLIALKVAMPSDETTLSSREAFDQLQVTLAKVWVSRLRKTDVLCRYHEGLFLVLLPNTELENASLLANDLTKASENYEFDGHQTIRIQARIIGHEGLEYWENWLDDAVI